MRHLCIKTAGVLFFLCIIGNALKAQSKVHSSNSAPVKNITLEFPDSISLGDKVYTLSTIWSEIKYNFVNIDHLKFNPDSLYKATIPLIIATKNDIAYYDILKRFICAFGDGHTQLMNESYSWNDYFDYIPVGIKEFKDEYYFTSIRKKSGIDSTLLGAKIIEIEGVPAIKYIEDNYFPTIAASTLQHKYFQATGRIGQGTAYDRG